MPKSQRVLTKRKRKAPPKPSTEVARDALEQILVGISVLSDVDKFLLAGLVDWMRNHWRGEHAEVANGGKLVEAADRIRRGSADARAEVLASIPSMIADATEGNLRAAVTS
jgi:hypothetical protein